MKQAIILAGGFGTRLQSVVSDVPKPMAPVAEKPFLEYLLQFAHKHGIRKSVLSVGYKHETIQDYFGAKYKDIDLEYAIETQPLGTGGGIKLALEMCEAEDVYVLNGDTFFDISMHDLAETHALNHSDLTIAVKYMQDFDRYGCIAFDKDEKIQLFEEKQARKEGFINGGIYMLKKSFLMGLDLPEKFSFEQAVMERYYEERNFYVFSGSSDRYFIDIGIPEDYERVQLDFQDNRKHYNK